MAKKKPLQSIKLPAHWPATNIEARAVRALVPYAHNPRQHSEAQVDQLAKAITEYGWTVPVLVDDDGTLIAGHGRVLAAAKLGIQSLPVMVVRNWTDAQKTSYRIWDNQSTLLGTWDTQLLAGELRKLEDLHYPLEFTGIDHLQLVQFMAQGEDAEDPPIPPLPKNPVSHRGDLWTLGKHQILCGDCRDVEDMRKLIGNRGPINVAITSPPYAEQRDYDKQSGFKPIPPSEYVAWFQPVAANIAAHLSTDGSWFLNIKPSAEELDTELYVFDLVLAHVREWGWHFATEFCWDRPSVPKAVTRRFKNQFEPIYQFARNQWKMRPHAVVHESDDVPVPYGPGGGASDWPRSQGQKGGVLFTAEGIAKGKKKPLKVVRGKFTARAKDGGSPNSQKLQGTKWQPEDFSGPPGLPKEYIGPGFAFPGNRLPTFAHTHEASGHPAAFPVGLPAFFIRAYSDKGDLIFDPFLGSGSTLLAADQFDRIGYGMELSPAYCDIAVERWQNHTGGQAQRQKA